MEKYARPKIPREAQRYAASPRYCFRSKKSFASHEWHVTKIALILMRTVHGGQEKLTGVLQVDPLDQAAIVTGLRILMVRDEEIPPTHTQEAVGLCKICSLIFYIVTVQWDQFLEEAESHLQILVRMNVLWAT